MFKTRGVIVLSFQNSDYQEREEVNPTVSTADNCETRSAVWVLKQTLKMFQQQNQISFSIPTKFSPYLGKWAVMLTLWHRRSCTYAISEFTGAWLVV